MTHPERRILLVCTGNMHRSPIMQTVLATQLAKAPHIKIASAGTAARRYRRWPPQTVAALTEAGYALPTRIRTRPLTKRDIRGAELVITASGGNRVDVLTLDPGAELRCFTLLEAARLLQNQPLSGDGLVADLQTALTGQREEHDDDLADPAGGSADDFRLCVTRVEEAMASLAPRLRPAADTASY